MTSSLVGSEMCIRDSNRSSFASINSIRYSSSPSTTTATANDDINTSSISVSYTHLTLADDM
eukprot:6998563-Prorocentrum_lima.AAC.1